MNEENTAAADVRGNSQETYDAIFHKLDPAKYEIRLAILGPAPSFEAPPVCRLKVVRLSSNPAFEALSWAWGDASDVDQVVLEGNSLHVASNLAVALRCLRRTSSTRLLWIDALCINQSGSRAALEERNQQVQFMKTIYSRASHVIIWMGLPSDDMAYSLYTSLLGSQGLLEAARNDPEDIIRFLTDLLSQSWWRRLWVLQEAILASMASVYFGSESYPFQHLLEDVRAVVIEFRRNTPNVLAGPAYHLARFYAATMDIFEKIRRKAGDGIYRPLEDFNDNQEIGPSRLLDERSKFFTFASIMTMCRYQLTADPRDKIYALLGLADDIVTAKIRPDYSESIVATFIRTTHILINSSGSLFLLYYAYPDVQNENTRLLPSWVPDWSVTREMHDTRYVRATRHEQSNQASAHLLARTDLLSNNVLKLQGIRVDTVSTCDSERWELRDYETWKATSDGIADRARDLLAAHKCFLTPKQISKFQRLLIISPPSAATMFLSFSSPVASKLRHFPKHGAYRYSPVSSDYSHDEHLEHSEESTEPDDYLQAYRSTLLMDRASVPEFTQAFQIWQSPELKPRSPGDSNSVWDKAAHVVFKELEMLFSDRRLFVTKDGFMGNGPRNTRPGDEIFVLAGGKLPFVLRPTGTEPNTYTLVGGDCYVQGIMDGEAVTEDYGSARKRQRQAADVLSSGTLSQNDVWEDVYLT